MNAKTLMTRGARFLKYCFLCPVYLLYVAFLKIKFFVLEDYYQRLAVQAHYLYKQSELFKMRWQAIGLEYAEESFEYERILFFRKAQREPFLIRWRIFMDSLFDRPARPYYINETN